MQHDIENIFLLFLSLAFKNTKRQHLMNGTGFLKILLIYNSDMESLTGNKH